MYNIVCCIIFGFFTIIGISNSICFLIEYLFKFDGSNYKTITENNIEYIIRSSKYCKNKYKINLITNANKDMLFILNRLSK